MMPVLAILFSIGSVALSVWNLRRMVELERHLDRLQVHDHRIKATGWPVTHTDRARTSYGEGAE